MYNQSSLWGIITSKCFWVLIQQCHRRRFYCRLYEVYAMYLLSSGSQHATDEYESKLSVIVGYLHKSSSLLLHSQRNLRIETYQAMKFCFTQCEWRDFVLCYLRDLSENKKWTSEKLWNEQFFCAVLLLCYILVVLQLCSVLHCIRDVFLCNLQSFSIHDDSIFFHRKAKRGWIECSTHSTQYNSTVERERVEKIIKMLCFFDVVWSS